MADRIRWFNPARLNLRTPSKVTPNAGLAGTSGFRLHPAWGMNGPLPCGNGAPGRVPPQAVGRRRSEGQPDLSVVRHGSVAPRGRHEHVDPLRPPDGSSREADAMDRDSREATVSEVRRRRRGPVACSPPCERYRSDTLQLTGNCVENGCTGAVVRGVPRPRSRSLNTYCEGAAKVDALDLSPRERGSAT